MYQIVKVIFVLKCVHPNAHLYSLINVHPTAKCVCRVHSSSLFSDTEYFLVIGGVEKLWGNEKYLTKRLSICVGYPAHHTFTCTHVRCWHINAWPCKTEQTSGLLTKQST